MTVVAVENSECNQPLPQSDLQLVEWSLTRATVQAPPGGGSDSLNPDGRALPSIGIEVRSPPVRGLPIFLVTVELRALSRKLEAETVSPTT